MNKQILKKIDIKTQGDLYRIKKNNPQKRWKNIFSSSFHYGKTEIESLLENVTPYIDAIEISNNSKTKEEVIYLYNYAKNNDLLISAGSDYHGEEDYHNLLTVEDLDKQMEQEISSWTKNCKNLIKK